MDKLVYDRIIRLINKIDELINLQLNKIIHHTRFQALESLWRSLAFLLQHDDHQGRLQIKIISINFKELQKDLLNSIEFDQSQLFKKVYSQEFDQAGGLPFGLLVGDYQFSSEAKELDTLREIMKISAAAFAPFIASVSPSIFGVNEFSELKIHLEFNDQLKLQEYKRWIQLRKEEDARFIGLTMPRFLIRQPYNQYGNKITNRFFLESTETQNNYLWANTAFAYAKVICNAYLSNGWLADIRGMSTNEKNGGGLKKLPRNCFSVNSRNDISKITTDIYLTDHQEKIYSDMGFIPFRDHPFAQNSVFYTCNSIQLPKKYSNDNANQNANISSMLHYILCSSRFAHYIKVMIRDKTGKFISADECEYYIQQWLLKYCAASQHISTEAKARYPLNEAKVKIESNPAEPGNYHCTLHLKPHYQLDEVQSHLTLVTNISIN